MAMSRKPRCIHFGGSKTQCPSFGRDRTRWTALFGRLPGYPRLSVRPAYRSPCQYTAQTAGRLFLLDGKPGFALSTTESDLQAVDNVPYSFSIECLQNRFFHGGKPSTALRWDLCATRSPVANPSHQFQCACYQANPASANSSAWNTKVEMAEIASQCEGKGDGEAP